MPTDCPRQPDTQSAIALLPHEPHSNHSAATEDTPTRSGGNANANNDFLNAISNLFCNSQRIAIAHRNGRRILIFVLKNDANTPWIIPGLQPIHNSESTQRDRHNLTSRQRSAVDSLHHFSHDYRRGISQRLALSMNLR